MGVEEPGQKTLSRLYTPHRKESKRFQDYSICILTPCKDYDLPAKFAKCVANMVAYSWMYGLKIYQMGLSERMVVDWARNHLADLAKDHINEYTGEKFTHVLWLDDDHVFDPDLACVLASHEKDMVSALYYGRSEPYLPVVYVKDTSDDKYKYFPLVIAPDALFECDAAGFGAMLMKREVLEKVPKPWFTIDWKCGEDIAFCTHAREHGVKIFCDGRYKLGHIGTPPIITWKDNAEYMGKNPERFKDKIKINVGV